MAIHAVDALVDVTIDLLKVLFGIFVALYTQGHASPLQVQRLTRSRSAVTGLASMLGERLVKFPFYKTVAI
jgi:hypothetical protein